MDFLLKKSVQNIFFLFLCCLFLNSNATGTDKLPPKFRHNVGPTMTFLYCYSCGYRKTFEDYVNIIVVKYPEMTVIGANYDPPGFCMYLSKVLFIAKIFLIVVIVASFDLFGAIGRETPSWWRHLLDNKLYACMMIYFIGNMVEGQLVSSGAFEISLNEVPVWSKLETGRFPASQELFQIIDNQLQFSEKIQANPDFVK